MNAAKILLALCFVSGSLAYAQDDSNQTIGLKSGSSTKLTFDVAGKKDETVVGIKGEMPLSANERAFEHFKERMGNHSSIELYGVVDIGFQHTSR